MYNTPCMKEKKKLISFVYSFDYLVVFSSTQNDWSTGSYYNELHNIISSLVHALQLIETWMSLLKPR